MAGKFEPVSMLACAASRTIAAMSTGEGVDLAKVGLHVAPTSLIIREARQPSTRRPRAGAGHYDDFVDAVFALKHPAAWDTEPGPERLTRYLSAIFTWQGLMQLNPAREVARSHVLLERYATTDMPDREAWREHLGISLNDFLTAAFVLEVVACKQRGWLTPQDVVNPLEASGDHDPAILQQAIEGHFVADLDELRRIATDHAPDDPLYLPWALNPLAVRPVIAVHADRWLCPIPRLALRRASLQSLYFDGRDAFGGDTFSTELGRAFEEYVHAVLKMLEPTGVVHREITYDKSQKRSVDFMVVLDDVVLLIEAKACRPIEELRLGHPKGIEDLQKKIDRAFGQIGRSADLIAQQHPAFQAIPNDRPVLGLVLTIEPFFLARNPNDPFTPLSETTTRSAVIHIERFETLVEACASAGDIGPSLSRFISHDDDLDPTQLVEGNTIKPLPMLEEFWNRLEARPWPQRG